MTTLLSYQTIKSIQRALLKENPLPFWSKSTANSLLLIIAMCSLTTLADHWGWFRPFETAVLDKALRVNFPTESKFTQLVAIDDTDYKEIFENKSPLKTDLLVRLIEQIASANPKAIVVDIDTSGEEWGQVEIADRFANGPPIIWSQQADVVDGGIEDVFAAGALGGTKPPLLGIAMLPTDWDNVVRRYRRIFDTPSGTVSSVPWKVVETVINGESPPEGLTPERLADLRKLVNTEGAKNGGEVVLNFAGNRFDFQPISAGIVMKISHLPAWRSDGPLTGKIVFLGQEHRATRDDHVTPIGMVSGLRILAQAVECELQGKSASMINFYLMLILDLAGSLCLFAIHHYCKEQLAFWVSIWFVPVVCFGGSLLVFGTLTYWASFVPVFFGVLLDLIHGHFKRYVKLLAESESKKSKLTNPSTH